MIDFRYHPDFEKVIAELEKRRLRHIRDSLAGFQKLCEFHFHPTSPEVRINPGKLHRVTQSEVGTLWKTELVIIKSGLRPNQYPRVWFVVSGATIAFLCLATHMDNYRDEDMNCLAFSRMTDLF